MPSWPETLTIQPIKNEEKSGSDNHNKAQDGIVFSIASFNVLAEAYLTPRSHTNLPPTSARFVFDKPKRRKLLCQTLTKLAETFDILCLQELDHALRDIVVDCLSKRGFGYVIAPREGVNFYVSDETAKKHETGSVKEKTKNTKNTSRSDGCATFYNRSKFKCIRYESVNFDDLAEESRPLLTDRINVEKKANSVDEMCSKEGSALQIEEKSRKRIQNRKKKKDPLSGIIASYRRRNTALLIELEARHQSELLTAQNIIIANAHLYWHPGYEYVKLSQAHFLLHRVKQFVPTFTSSPLSKGVERPMPAVVICGDMNSKPNSYVHEYFTKGFVDARKVAPWNFHFDEAEEQEEIAMQMKKLSLKNHINSNCEDLDQEPVEIGYIDASAVDLVDKTNHTELNGCTVDTMPSFFDSTSLQKSTDIPAYDNSELVGVNSSGYCSDGSAPMRYLLDITLNKFTRWLRILGLDAAIETAEEERLRTGEGEL